MDGDRAVASVQAPPRASRKKRSRSNVEVESAIDNENSGTHNDKEDAVDSLMDIDPQTENSQNAPTTVAAPTVTTTKRRSPAAASRLGRLRALRKESDIAAAIDAKSLPVPDDTVWKETVLSRIPRCDAAEGLQETSYFRNKFPVGAGSSSSGRTHCLRRLLQEIASLEEDLPHNPAIWLRFDEETPQFLRALITAPTQTPYSLGLFCFDIFVPDTYPLVPPKMQLLTTGRGTVRFSPNLYADGKVCLSLLNTWNGPRWNPHHSTLLQCLVSLQGLILGVEHPYYLEPGHGGWEGQISEAPTVPASSSSSTPTAAAVARMIFTAADSSGTQAAAAAAVTSATPTTTSAAETSTTVAATPRVPYHVLQFEDRIRLGTCRYAMLDMILSVQNASSSSSNYKYLRAFGDIITAHFFHCQERIVQETLLWASTMKSTTQRRQFKQVATDLQDVLTKLQPLPTAPATSVAKGAAAGMKGLKKGGEDTVSEDPTDRDSKMSPVESADAQKTAQMEEAAAHKDYITAGRLQTELLHASRFGSVESKVSTKRQEMELAASKGDYITAGQLQVAVKHLESNKKLLQNLEKRMLDCAAKMDFVRAGRFQEQYKILLSCEGDSLSSSKAAAQSMAASGSAAGGAAGMGPTGYSMAPFYGGTASAFPFKASASHMKAKAALHAFPDIEGADYVDEDDFDGYGDY